MNNVFEPTGYKFTIPTGVFVEVHFLDGEQGIKGSFDNIDDAYYFARAKLQCNDVRGVLIFTNHKQLDSIWKPISKAS